MKYRCIGFIIIMLLLLTGCVKTNLNGKEYKNYDNNIVVEIDRETGSRNIIKNGEYLYGISPENKNSNEELLKAFNLK